MQVQRVASVNAHTSGQHLLRQAYTYTPSKPTLSRAPSLFKTLRNVVVTVLVTGELEPQEGTVWKHPNLRIAYVAQHAFHHIEQHLDKTANQYIQVSTSSTCSCLYALLGSKQLPFG
jgi:hypothetical protein